MSRRARALFAVGGLVACACAVETIDLREESLGPVPGDPACGWRERLDPRRGVCVPCEYRLPHPLLACPCAWAYLPAALPYCDAADAYYDCLPCSGGIDACNAYDAETRTSSNCASLTRCCDELEETGATPCCAAGSTFHCVYDAAASSVSDVFRAGCVSEPCCVGPPCPNGQGDCAGFQSCVGGRCTPACEPGAETCEVVASQGSLACLCLDVDNLP